MIDDHITQRRDSFIASEMGNGNSSGEVEDFNINWKVKKGATRYDYYIDGNKVSCVTKSLMKTRTKTWVLSDHKIEAVEKNSDHILFLDSEGKVLIIKYGKPPARIKVPWKVKRIYSEQSLACDFSLLFCRKQGGLSEWCYHVISITNSNVNLPRVRADQIASREGFNVTEFTTDTITSKGMLSKVLDLGDNRAQLLSTESSKVKMNISHLIEEDPPANDNYYDDVIANLRDHSSPTPSNDNQYYERSVNSSNHQQEVERILNSYVT